VREREREREREMGVRSYCELVHIDVGCVRFQNEEEWNGMVPFRGNETVPTPCLVQKKSRNGMVSFSVRFITAERNGLKHDFLSKSKLT
jgi:hypothetical protein